MLDRDPLFEEAKQLIIKDGYISQAQLQIHFIIGYNRSGRITDQLEEAGIISEFLGLGKGDLGGDRKILIKS